MSHEPLPFTDAQWELFYRVCLLNRGHADDFAEAEQWLESLARSGIDRYLRFRSCYLDEARQRRQRRDRAWGIDLIRHEDGHGTVCCDRSTWQQLPQDQREQWLREARTLHGRNLRWQRRRLWAHRLLRLIWIMTDTEDLMTTQLSWLQAWQWGIDTLEFLSGLPDDPARPVPRLWLRVTILDRHIEQWQRLAEQALQVIELAG